jgi:beta-lactamase superfamily II metal-dependent hydrolase
VNAPAINLEVLPAGYGDCLLVSCPVGDRLWRMLVDTGPDECWPQLRERLSKIAPDSRGRRHIDLAVISHIDHDHIGGAALLFNDKSLGLSFGDIWFNAPPRRLARGVAEGVSLATLLGATAADLPWNKAFGGKHVATRGDGGFVELPTTEGMPRITLLSPTPARWTSLFKVWDRELERLRRREVEKLQQPEAAPRGAAALDLEALAASVTKVDAAPANGSSIAFLLEHEGASVLLAADAFATVLSPALQALARHRKQPGGLSVDAIKLSHHGSKGNVTTELLKSVRADHYIVSTNGAIFKHPDDEAIARVVLNGGRRHSLCFNYRNERSLRWADESRLAQHGCRVVLPEAGREGFALALGTGKLHSTSNPTRGRPQDAPVSA